VIGENTVRFHPLAARVTSIRRPASPAPSAARPRTGNGATTAPRTTSGRRRPTATAEPTASHGSPEREALETILRAAGELLDERGTDGLNTTAVAKRAGISTATLYRHFPDKHAVLRALVQHVYTARAAAILPCLARIETETDWRAPLIEALHLAHRMRLAMPGGRSMRRALQSSPELWQWDQNQMQEVARELARVMRRRRPELSRAVAERAALTVMAGAIALLDLASLLGERAGRALLDEGAEMFGSYLARHLD